MPGPVQSAGDQQDRDAEGRWRPGQSGNPRGRRRGVRNRATATLRGLADALLADASYWPGVVARIKAGEAPALELYLWSMRFGRPRIVGDVTAGPDPVAMRALGEQVTERLTRLAERLARSRDGASPD